MRSCINHYGLKSQGFVYAVRDRAAVMRVRENPTLQKCFHRDGYVEYRLDGHKTKAKVSK